MDQDKAGSVTRRAVDAAILLCPLSSSAAATATAAANGLAPNAAAAPPLVGVLLSALIERVDPRLLFGGELRAGGPPHEEARGEKGGKRKVLLLARCELREG